MTDHKRPNADKKHEMTNPGGKASQGHSETPDKAARAGGKNGTMDGKSTMQPERKPDAKAAGKPGGHAEKAR